MAPDFVSHPTFSTALALFLALAFAHLFAKTWKRHRSRMAAVAAKKYHPVAGTALNQLLNFGRLHHYMTDLAGKHGTYRLLGPFWSEVYTSDPANVEYMLKTNFKNYGKGRYNYSLLKDLLGDGIFAVDGDKWRQQRKVSSYEFSTKVLRDFSSVVFQRNAAKLANILSEAASPSICCHGKQEL